MATQRSVLIKALNETFPGILATPGEAFGRDYGVGIWFRGTESATITVFHEEIDESFDMPVFDREMYMDTFGTNPKLESFLQDNGWYSEPYDAGTLFAYK